MKAARTQNDAPVFPDQDLDDAPLTRDDTATRKVAENTAAGEAIGDPIVAEDDDNDVLTYTLEAADAPNDADVALFAIDRATGQLKTKAKLDFEDETNPTDNEYMVIVRATDPDGMPEADPLLDSENSDVITVTITVTDVNEAPVVSGDAAVSFAENGDITNMLAQRLHGERPGDERRSCHPCVDGG